MKNLILFTLIASLCVLVPKEGTAQDNPDSSSLVYALQYNQSDYTAMQKKHYKQGIKTFELGNWLTQNGQVSIILKPGEDLDIAGNSKNLSLFIFVVNAQGKINGNEILKTKITTLKAKLKSLISSKQLGNALNKAFPSDTFFPTDTFFPSETFFPTDTFLEGNKELQKMAVETGLKAISKANIGKDALALVLVIAPEKLEKKMKLSPGGAVFVSGSAGKK